MDPRKEEQDRRRARLPEAQSKTLQSRMGAPPPRYYRLGPKVVKNISFLEISKTTQNLSFGNPVFQKVLIENPKS